MTLYLDKTFAAEWGDEPFARALAQPGEVFREKEGRRTLRFEVGGAGYFLKLHQGVGWLEVAKNLAQLRLPVVGAGSEWRAINKLRALGLRAPAAAAFGSRGWNPARRLSFIVTRELAGTISLEELCADWQRPPRASELALKRALLAEVAALARAMHAGGVNHRDFYLCHLRIDVSMGLGNLSADNIRLTVLDLHRAQVRRRTPARWRIKDLGGLYFSARDLSLTARDVLRFMKIYSGRDARGLLGERAFWRKVARKARRIHRGDFGCEAQLPLE